MKYSQPFDQPGNPNAPYVNGNPATGTQGSIPPGAAFEQNQREIVQAITDVGLATPSGTDLTQLSTAIRFMRSQFVQDAGPANAIQVTLNPAPAVWASPLSFFVKINSLNTSATVTCAIAGLPGTKAVIKRNGAALVAGDLTVGLVVLCVYDGTAVRVLSTLASDITVPATLGFFNIQVITASGNYTKTAGASKALIFATGGGGAGGSSNGLSQLVGTGGESGATAIALLDLTGVTTKTCIIGAAGAPAATGAAINTQAGQGGQTSFDIIAIALGGQGGYNSVGCGTPAGGTTGSTGLIIIRGDPGEGPQGDSDSIGTETGMRGGNGGSSIWGGAGRGADANATGLTTVGRAGYPATGYGSGGGGGDSGTLTAEQGGAGMPGIIVVAEF